MWSVRCLGVPLDGPGNSRPARFCRAYRASAERLAADRAWLLSGACGPPSGLSSVTWTIMTPVPAARYGILAASTRRAPR